MFKTIASALAVTAVLSVAAAAPASAWERHHGHGGFGIAALAGGVIGAVIGAEIVSHSSYSAPRPTHYDYGPVTAAATEVVKVCPPGTHLGPYRKYCWAN